MSKTLYLECSSGISGDMTVAALLDLGADRRTLEEALKSLPIQGFKINISRVLKSELDACDFEVVLDAVHENHDHDMKYLHDDHYDHDHEHHQEHQNSQEHHTMHSHEHRSLSEILEIIDHSGLTIHAKEIASHIFSILADAESKAHGVNVEQVHFHEVGAVDSVVDIISAAVCIDNLAITDVIVPELYEGKGFIRCQHGMLPIPVPAVLNIAAKSGLNLHIMDWEGEFVTPTGAAIVAAIKTSDKLPEHFSIQKIGIGAGKRTYERPSILRAMLIQSDETENDSIYQLESNIDDCSGETLGFTMDRLFEAGARDVFYMPIYMKKNRPAYQLNVICRKEDIHEMEQIIFEETTTIGIRRIQLERTILKREIKKIMTSLGEVQIKVCNLTSGVRSYPEYSSIVELCKKHQMSYQKVYRTIINEIGME